MKENFYKCVERYKESMIDRGFVNIRRFGWSYLRYTLRRLGMPMYGDIKATIFTGRQLVLPADDLGSHQLAMYGILTHRGEQALTTWIMDNVKEKDVFYDVGAHLGFYTALTSDLGAEVHTWEMSNKTYTYLIKNFQSDKHVKTLNHNAVTRPDLIGESLHYTEGVDSSQNMLNTSGKNSALGSTIDTHLNSNPLAKPPTIIKMDIEGGEYDALLGTENILRKYKPIVILEVWEGTNDTIRFLENLGYKGSILGKDRGRANMLFTPV